ncbi:MAG: Crp/Fnr family transcriptional regulator [bacterium]
MYESESIAVLFAAQPVKTISAGVTLIQPDQKSVHAYLLETGVVKILSFSSEGESVLIHLLQPGSTFPLLSMSPTPSNRFWFQSMTPITVKQIKYAQFVQLIQKDPQLLLAQYHKMLQAAEGLAYRVESLITQDVHARLWSALEYLQKHFGVAVSPGVTRIDLHVTHQDLASFIGSSRETVSREWERLKTAGKVDLVEGKIVIR